MLRELHVRNYALIDRVDIEFGPGLNLITGETGAGKSVLIDALGLALGERSTGTEQVRSGADRAIVEAIFDLCDAPPATRAKLDEYGVAEEDEDALLAARELTAAGKSVCRINGRLLPLGALREIAADLIDVHGQHEHQSLLSPERHLLLLDEWLGNSALSQREAVASEFTTLTRLRRQLDALRNEARERARNLDLYRYQLAEIEDASPREHEEEELAADRSRLANAERLRASSEEAYEALSDAGMDALNAALTSVSRAAQIDTDLDGIRSTLAEAVTYADDARKDLRRYRDRLEFNPERLDEIENRLSLLHALRRKYGDSIEEVLAFGTQLADKITRLEGQDALEAENSVEIANCQARLDELSARLTQTRREGSSRFAGEILAQTADLGMPATRFEVKIEPAEQSGRGADEVEFVISTNPGEPLRPLAKIASGGELSRFMLAMKSVLARAAFVPSLIFDEIDVGIGGRTATVIADKLCSLSRTAQVICITHLPQIASRPASAHFNLEKRARSGRTVIEVSRLSDEARVDEIVRMLGGEHGSDTVVRHAREMLTTGPLPESRSDQAPSRVARQDRQTG